ncbi:MAG: hypothetical protein JW860_02350 [Sedimentisphaerales bacterium]|nr:hypothetical protein [Sedimentisphaerales bacterium]
MSENEKQFKEYINDLHWDDRPDPAHRDQLEARLLHALSQSNQRQTQSPRHKWRLIMHSRIIKLTTVAAVFIIIFAVTWMSSQDPNGRESLSAFTLVQQAFANERLYFNGDEIVHIVNEIIVYPRPAVTDNRYDSLVENWGLNPQQGESMKTVLSWLDYNWLPVCSMQANGEFRFHQLNLVPDEQLEYTVTDQAWYDPGSGRFIRVMQTEQKVFFANSYDGRAVYSYEKGPDNSLQVVSQPVSADFRPPQDPAGFLGLAAGLQNSLDEQNTHIIHTITDDTLPDGTPITTYKLGFEDIFGDVNTYWLSKVRDDNNTIAQMDFILAGYHLMTIRRVSTESVDTPAMAWDLAEMKQPDSRLQQEHGPQVVINPDMVIIDVSAGHMVEHADYETYIFAQKPYWTTEPMIVDCLDLPTPPHRMFSIVYNADSGRQVILVQAQTYNNIMGALTHFGPPIYTAPNGFKVHSGGPVKWWTNIILQSTDLTPAEDRTGYVLASPAGTYPCLVINGPITEEELHGLIDSLIPASEYEDE